MRNAVSLKSLSGHFPFSVPETASAWEERRRALRLRVAIAAGLHPMLPRPEIKATIRPAARRDGFEVDKVWFESLPGHYVTGLLFRPETSPLKQHQQKGKKRPAILSPHGHGGRLQCYDDETLADLIDSGDERFANSGRMPKIARCAQLARMGCVSFIFDMVGYGDSLQLSRWLAHTKRTVRPAEIVASHLTPQLFDSTPAVARMQSIFGLQTFNALRAFDFLAGLPEVDSNRIGVTGGSGGGTQTIVLGALDDRIAASFPNGMVSTSMQGGCPCENACYLRIDTGNVELAGLIAPTPMGMTAADDWTRDMMRDGFPELQRLYELLGAKSFVQCRPLLQFKHNYNYVTRGTMYEFMNRFLELDASSPIIEQDYESLSPEELTIWTRDNPMPGSQGTVHESEILTWWDENTNQALQSPDSFNTMIRPALETIYDVAPPDSDEISLAVQNQSMVAGTQLQEAQLNTRQQSYPVQILSPVSGHLQKLSDITVFVTESVQRLTDAKQYPRVHAEIAAGNTVLAIGLGSATGRQDRVPPTDDRISSRGRSIVYTYGYNRPLAVKRTAAILAALVAAESMLNKPPQEKSTSFREQSQHIPITVKSSLTSRIRLYSDAGFAASALPAVAIAGARFAESTVDCARFRFGDLRYQDDV
ncbi:MAG: acetylxylan esterase, partial [Planctomycetota bacterium]